MTLWAAVWYNFPLWRSGGNASSAGISTKARSRRRSAPCATLPGSSSACWRT